MLRHADAKDRLLATSSHLPPAELRYSVGGSPDAEEFVAMGKICATDIQAAVRKVGHELESFRRILDFGCGCGRTLIHMRSLAPNAEIEGTDINPVAVEWCKRHLSFAAYSVNQPLPPTNYGEDTFDFIYAISVFTHLDEDYQFRWLAELQRVTKPGGIVVLTVNGLDGDKEFVFERSYEEGLFPGWYQNTYQSRKHVFASFGRFFKVMDYIPRGMGEHQDVVVLKKAASGF
jgi:cyclopropane fatty-acyl-phospholipid synthase-like methyltransferase